MEREKIQEGKGDHPPDPGSKTFAMVWMKRSGKEKGQEASGKELEVQLQRPRMSDDDSRNGGNGGTSKENEDANRKEEAPEKPRNQFPIKLDFKIPREVKFYNCAAVHKEWFEMIKRKDASAKLITYKDAALSNIKDFPVNQEQYNRAFPQRVTRQPGQPRTAEVVFELETVENFQTLKTQNKEMMEFLFKRGVYMKMNIALARRRDAVGYFTHVHPRVTWRQDFQEKIVKEMRKYMTDEEVKEAIDAADNQDTKEMFVTLNFRKQYIQAEEGLIQTETLEIQAAPEIKAIVNNALFRASKNGTLPGKYFPYGISKTLGVDEYRKILQRQNAFLATTQVIGIQGLTEELLKAEFSTNEKDGSIKMRTAREILTGHFSIISLEKTNLSKERGKYNLICKKNQEKEAREFIDAATKYINEVADWEDKHVTYPEIRRSSPNRWNSEIQEYAETLHKTQEEEYLPRKPPNAWNQKIIFDNDPEKFPPLQEAPTPKVKNSKKLSKAPEKTINQEPKNNTKTSEKMKEIEERINRQVEERIKRLEEKCAHLEENVSQLLNMFDSFSKSFQKAEERAVVTEQNTQKNFETQLNVIKNQFQELAKDLMRTIENKDKSMEIDQTETKKRNIKGKEKTLNNQE
jgi:hypothetical protein